MNSPDLSWLDEGKIDADCPDDVRQALGLSTRLDSPETSILPILPMDYRAWRTAQAAEEIEATRRVLAAIYVPHQQQKMDRYDDCRKRASFAVHRETGRVRVLSSACRDRWCVFCAKARASEVSEQIIDWLNRVKNPRFLTLTLKSSSAPLADQIDNLYRCFRLFRKLKEVRSTIKAGIWFFQITYNTERQQFHPHLHCCIIGKYREKAWYSTLWNQVTKGSFIVDIHAVTNNREAATYIGRYVARPALLSKYSLEQGVEIVDAFHGRRLFGTWGPKPIRPEIRRRKLDRSAWQVLKSWIEIYTERGRDCSAKIIWNCWKDRTPLPKEFYEQGTAPFTRPPKPPDPQGVLFDPGHDPVGMR